MRLTKPDLICFLGALALTLILWLFLSGGQGAVELVLHDTYFVINFPSSIILILGPVLSVIFFVRGLANSFTLIGSNLFLIGGLSLLGCISFRITNVLIPPPTTFSGIVQGGQVLPTPEDQLSFSDFNVLAWGLFVICLVCMICLIWQTVRIFITRRL